MNFPRLFPTRLQRRRTAQRGSALATTVTLMFAMSIITLGLISLVNGAMSMSRKRSEVGQSFNLADSGVDLAMLWLSQQGAPPDANACKFTGSAFFGTGGVISSPLGVSGATLTITINTDTTNPGSTQKHYVVDSTARLASGATQSVRAYVQQNSFGKYAMFVDNNPSSGSFWGSGLNVFDGPVHSNNSNGGSPPTANGYANNVLWQDGSGAAAQPVFTYQGADAFTVSGPAINWWRNAYGNVSGPTSETEWRKIASGGSASVHTGTPIVPLPAATSEQHDAAMGNPAVATPAASVGVVVPSSGGNATQGVFIHGPVDDMTLSAQGNTRQLMTIKQTDSNGNPYTTVVTMDPSANQTSVDTTYYKPNGNSGTYTVKTTHSQYNGVTNGVVYCDDDIGGQGIPKSGGISGVVADGRALTIATDTAHNANIDGNLTLNTPRATDAQGNPLPESATANANFLSKAGTVGIVSNNVEVTDKDSSGNNITNIEVDAAVMAFGTYDACDYTTRPVGKMLNMGCYIVKQRGLFATANGAGIAITGIPCSRSYDNRLADHPPPYFPTTGNTYEVLSWQRVTSTL